MMKTPIYETTIAGAEAVRLYQTGVDRFTVQVSQTDEADLSYGRAACALGGAIMEALAATGKLDNRTRNQAKRDAREGPPGHRLKPLP
jgi:hypothetical protein